MSDVVYQSLNETAPPPEAAVEPVSESTTPSVDLSQIAHHDDVSRPLSLEQAAALTTRRRREREGTEEIIERYVPQDGPVRLKDAQKGLSDVHKQELGQQFLKSLGTPATPSQDSPLPTSRLDMAGNPLSCRFPRSHSSAIKATPFPN